MRNHPGLAVLAVAAVLTVATRVEAQACAPVWGEPMFETGGVVGVVRSAIVFDDGTGAQLYVGGDTLQAGTVSSHCVRFNGSRWSAVGSLPGIVYEFAVYDPGTGPMLFACGEFVDPVSNYSVRRWNPSTQSWVLVAYADNHVITLASFNDVSGPVLVVGGFFTNIGGIACSRIATWNGATWGSFGAGADGSVRALRTHNDGTGEKLYAGGGFSMVNSIAASCVAVWFNGAWSALGAGMAYPAYFPVVYALEIFDDGGGPRLYAGGEFDSSGGTTLNNVAKWTGASWVPLGTGLTGTQFPGSVLPVVFTLRSADLDGPGGAPPHLLAGGYFLSAGGASITHLAAWNGSSWTSALGQGIAGYSVRRILAIPAPGGDLVVIVGNFGGVDGVSAGNIAVRSGGAWSSPNPGVTEAPLPFPQIPGTINSYAVWNDGTGPRLYGAGYLFLAGMPLGNYAVVWNGSSFAPIGLPFNADVNVLKVLDLGSGPELYAGGDFTAIGGVPAGRVARWTGNAWVPVGALAASVFDLALYDDGTGLALFAGTAASIARWNGAAWAGVPGAPSGAVYALEAFDPPGPGSLLFAGGSFATPWPYLTSFDGANWSAVGSGVTGPGGSAAIYDLMTFDPGTGPALHVCGAISTVGGMPAAVGRWDGSVWTPLESAPQLLIPNGRAFCLGTYDDGSGPALFAGGGGLLALQNAIAKWTGSNWINVGGGLTVAAHAIQQFDDGSGPGLFVGGELFSSGNGFQRRAAKVSCPRPKIALFQSGGVGSALTVQNLGLVQGHEYYNFFSIEPCAGLVGGGAYLGLCASSPASLLQQFALSVGAVPFHFIHAGPAQTATFGPYPLPPMTIDGICVDWSGGTPGAYSIVKRVTIY